MNIKDVNVLILKMIVCSAELEEVFELYEILSTALLHPHLQVLLYVARESKKSLRVLQSYSEGS